MTETDQQTQHPWDTELELRLTSIARKCRWDVVYWKMGFICFGKIVPAVKKDVTVRHQYFEGTWQGKWYLSTNLAVPASFSQASEPDSFKNLDWEEPHFMAILGWVIIKWCWGIYKHWSSPTMRSVTKAGSFFSESLHFLSQAMKLPDRLQDMICMSDCFGAWLKMVRSEPRCHHIGKAYASLSEGKWRSLQVTQSLVYPFRFVLTVLHFAVLLSPL